MSGTVVVIGLDGATFALLQPWSAARPLPYLSFFAGARRQWPAAVFGSTGEVPAWQCFMTGKNPGKHGVAWFLRTCRRLRRSADWVE